MHDARWISNGRPTALVRDGGHESTDAPPDHAYNGALTPVDEPVRRPRLFGGGLLGDVLDLVVSLPWPW